MLHALASSFYRHRATRHGTAIAAAILTHVPPVRQVASRQSDAPNRRLASLVRCRRDGKTHRRSIADT